MAGLPITPFPFGSATLCGCWFVLSGEINYLPQVSLSSESTIKATTSRTVLTQTFSNPQKSRKLEQVQYTFPLYDGVSVVGFKCTVASRTIIGVVKEKTQARTDYTAAIERGETAGLLEQLPEASDAFTTHIGNVPAGEKIVVEITYIGELKHDAETDGSRFTIPTFIAPRYGNFSSDISNLPPNSATAIATAEGGIRILVDVMVDQGSRVQGLQSPTHPMAVTMGRTSTMPEDTFDNNYASATLTLGGTTVLDKDFIIVILSKGQEVPRALLETHPSIPNHRALMATLVPKFNIPSIRPEIVFVVDRSGSMDGKIKTLVTALRIFLKSLPIGVKFNICSFGSHHCFLWPKSRSYDQASLQAALDHLNTFAANYGGTEMLAPIKATVENRFPDMPLEVMVITDGEIWNQHELFTYLNDTCGNSSRFFSLGIGAGASSSLVEGMARAGNGFAQFVGEDETMDKKVVRMLKGALTPHIKDYSLEVRYDTLADSTDDDYEMVESVADSASSLKSAPALAIASPKAKTISLFDSAAEEELTNPLAGRYDHLPGVKSPQIIQAPHKIPTLYAFNRTTIYLLMAPETHLRTPTSVTLRATSDHGPLELEIPVQNIGKGETLHQLAAKKAIHELEEGRGWITQAKANDGKLLRDNHNGRWDEMVEREAVRLGLLFQVGGKWCSFVAVEEDPKTGQQEVRPTEKEAEVQAPDAFIGGVHAMRFRSLNRPTSRGRGGYARPATQAPPPPAGDSRHVDTGSQIGNSLAMSSANYSQPPAPSGFSGLTMHHAMLSRQSMQSMDSRASARSSQAVQGPTAFGSGSALFSTSSSNPTVSSSKMFYSQSKKMKKSTTPPKTAYPMPTGTEVNDDANENKPTAPSFNNLQTDEDRMHALISLQSFDGSWTWTENFYKVLKLSGPAALQEMFSQEILALLVHAGEEDNNRATATIAAIAFLEAKVPAEADTWELLVQKASDWLVSKLGGGNKNLKVLEEEIGSVKAQMAKL